MLQIRVSQQWWQPKLNAVSPPDDNDDDDDDDDDVSLRNEYPAPLQYCTDGSKSMFLVDDSSFMRCQPL